MKAEMPSSAPRIVIEPAEAAVTPEQAVRRFGAARFPALLESLADPQRYGRFSVYACEPVHVVAWKGRRSRPFQELREVFARFPTLARPTEIPHFAGGWIGFISYEAALGNEGIPPAGVTDVPVPAVRFALYDAAAVYDHVEGRWWITAVEWPRPFRETRPPVSERIERTRRRLTEAVPAIRCDPPFASEPLQANLTYEQYADRVRRILAYIREGDIYQANMTLRFSARVKATSLAMYLRLRRTNPGSHAAYLAWDGSAVLCSSPELFLRVEGDHVRTRPIKGTRPRSPDPAVDASNRLELVHSEKDRAELTMIVDLLRNDLGRVCRFGSVRVIEEAAIESCPTVFHRVATIDGNLAPGRDWADLLAAACPGGSVTGAPKIRAMQIIAEMEPTTRGVYCGSIGWIGLDGRMGLNVAIRTMVRHGDRVYVHAGGGIVAESTPEDEYAELCAKAAGMFRAVDPSRPAPAGQPMKVTTA